MGPTSREQFTRPGKGLLWPQCLNKGDGRHRRGWVQCVPVAIKDGDPGRLMPTTKAGAMETWNVTFLAEKKFQLVWEVERYCLDIVRLTWRCVFGSRTSLLESLVKTCVWEEFNEAMKKRLRSYWSNSGTLSGSSGGERGALLTLCKVLVECCWFQLRILSGGKRKQDLLSLTDMSPVAGAESGDKWGT